MGLLNKLMEKVGEGVEKVTTKNLSGNQKSNMRRTKRLELNLSASAKVNCAKNKKK